VKATRSGSRARRVLLLTGERSSGKTTICLRVAEAALGAGLPVSGIASRGLCRGGRRVGLEAVDLASGAAWPLASLLERLDGPAIGPYSFSAAGLERALGVLERGAEMERGLLIVDEVGPLELERGEGFARLLPRLRALPHQPCPDLLLVVRPSLVAELQASLGEKAGFVTEARPESRDGLPLRILAAVRELRET
jgi:nucleoside-triphosphatase THEP1